jgi:DNA-binding Lrp family transcriptional regulator
MAEKRKWYRGYVLCRLSKIGAEWDVVNKVIGMRKDDSWIVTYASPVYGNWDLIIEVSFSQLDELDEIVTGIRTDDDLKDVIEETTTLVTSRPNYPLDDME